MYVKRLDTDRTSTHTRLATISRERIEEFLRKSLLGDELVHTQFHLFSAKSSPSGRVLKPRVLCANNVLLAKSSKYFLELLSQDVNPSDASLIDLTDDSDVPDHARMDNYGFASDSDLDDCDDSLFDAEILKDESAKIDSGTRSKDDDESDDESVSSDMFVMSPEQPRADEHFLIKEGRGSVASSETAVQGARADKTLANHAAMRLRSLGSRHILVKDTAFQTWYTLLNYLYTDQLDFLPLSSATPDEHPRESSTSSLDAPKCSAKSMYRLACKVGLDDLRDEAFHYIRGNLTEQNILKEISCSLISKHPDLLEMELDVLYTHIASPSVVANFSALAQRIAHRELAHGAAIIVGIHTRFLKEERPLPLKTAPAQVMSQYGGFREEKEDDVDEMSSSDEPDRPSKLAVPPPSGGQHATTPSPPVGFSSVQPGSIPVPVVLCSSERESASRPVPSSATSPTTTSKEKAKAGGTHVPTISFSSLEKQPPKDYKGEIRDFGSRSPFAPKEKQPPKDYKGEIGDFGSGSHFASKEKRPPKDYEAKQSAKGYPGSLF